MNKINILCLEERQKLRLTPNNTPINTGKVLIGSAYTPAKNHISNDQLWLQSALLAKHSERIQPLAMTLADKVMIALFIVAMPLVWLTR